jgi:hypothetical protein
MVLVSIGGFRRVIILVIEGGRIIGDGGRPQRRGSVGGKKALDLTTLRSVRIIIIWLLIPSWRLLILI